MAKHSKTSIKRGTVSIIGPGKVGQAFAHALQSLGYPILALVFRNREKVQRFSAHGRKFFPKTALLAFDDLAKLPKSDLVLITTPDDVIEKSAKKLAALKRPIVNSIASETFERPGAILHTSGALSSEILARLSNRNCQVGSMHPLISVTLPNQRTFKDAYFCIEGEPIAVNYAEEIVRDLGGNSVRIDTYRKALYHAAAVMASPHLIALYDLAVELMNLALLAPADSTEPSHDLRMISRRAEKIRPDAQRMLLPLVMSTVSNLTVSGSSGALTGTFARGDVETVKHHLKALTEGNPKSPAEALDIYKLLGRRSLKLAKQRGLDPKKIREITKLLKGK